MAITPGSLLNMTPNPIQSTLATNYIDFTATATSGWAQQYLPDLMEKEAEVFGNRTISGFLSQVGAEEPMTSDQVVWSEQGRLHLAYTGTVAIATSVVTITGHAGSNATYVPASHGLRVGDTVLVAMATGFTIPCRIVLAAAGTDLITCLPYGGANITNLTGTLGNGAAVTVLKYGSEWPKGSDTPYATANEPDFTAYSNKPVTIRDMCHVSGSDAAQIGWVETTGEDGQSGYLWYLKAEGETRMRFTDNLEMTCLEGVRPVAGSQLDVETLSGSPLVTPVATTGVTFGTEGLFASITNRGNGSAGILGLSCAVDLAEFDAILAEFDSQGAIEENMMFLDRTTSLAVDDMLACMNSYGAGGTSYGVFNNSEDMALNLGFSGFRRGSYDFYKSDWKYLNDAGTRGAINARDVVNAVRGVIVPAGVSSVYDQMLGKNLKRPFLHVRYRASQTDNRRFKTWVTGSVGAVTSDLDAMEIHMLSERCLIVQGANNFMIMK